MLPKCVETIDRLPHEGKDIVRSSGKPEKRVHHWDRHGFGHTPEPATSNRGSRNHNRSGNVRRTEELTPVVTGLIERGSGENIFGASFPIRGES